MSYSAVPANPVIGNRCGDGGHGKEGNQMGRTGATTSIGSLARQAGCKTVTVRYYERMGLLPKPERTPGGHRCYNDTHAERLIFIIRCRQLGFPLDQVRELLDLVDSGQMTCGEVSQIAQKHLRDVREKICELKRLEEKLSNLTDQCAAAATPDCPLIDSLASR